MLNRRTLVLLGAVLLAGCGPAASRTAAPVASASSLPAGCAAALALLPSSPPATAQQAGADFRRLGGRKGTTLDSLLDAVAADASAISFDLSEGQSVTSAVGKYQEDVQAVRAYCV